MATVAKPDKSFIVPLGHFKLEVIKLSSVSNDDTVESKLADPNFAVCLPIADSTGQTTNPSATVDGKTITIRDPGVSSVVVLVFGDNVWD